MILTLINDNIIRVNKNLEKYPSYVYIHCTEIFSNRTSTVLNKVNFSVQMGGKHNSLKVIVIYRKEPTKST